MAEQYERHNITQRRKATRQYTTALVSLNARALIKQIAEPMPTFFERWLEHYKTLYPVEKPDRLATFTAEVLFQDPRSPLGTLARLIDLNDGVLATMIVGSDNGDSLADKNVTFKIFFNFVSAIYFCVIGRSPTVEDDERELYFSKFVALKLEKMGVTGPGSAAVFLINFLYDDHFRNSLLTVWPDPLAHQLFEHGMRVEGLDQDVSEVFGPAKSYGMDYLVTTAPYKKDGLTVAGDEYFITLDILVQSYPTLTELYEHYKQTREEFNSIMVERNLQLVSTFTEELFGNPGGFYMQRALKRCPRLANVSRDIVIKLAQFSKCFHPVEFHPMHWINYCQGHAYFLLKRRVILHGGLQMNQQWRSYGQVIFFPEGEIRDAPRLPNSSPSPLSKTSSSGYGQRDVHPKYMTFNGREKVSCACCGRIICIHKSFECMGYYFCSVLEDRKRPSNLQNISWCAANLVTQYTGDSSIQKGDIPPHHVMTIMHPHGDHDQPNVYVVEVMRRAFAVPMHDLCYGMVPWLFKLYADLVQDAFTSDTPLVDVTEQFNFRDRIEPYVLQRDLTVPGSFHRVQDIFQFMCGVLYFCRIIMSNEDWSDISRYMESDTFRWTCDVAVKVLHLGITAKDTEGYARLMTDGEEAFPNPMEICTGGQTFLFYKSETESGDEQYYSCCFMSTEGFREPCSSIGTLVVLQQCWLGFCDHDDELNRKLIVMAARRKILITMYLTMTWRCFMDALLERHELSQLLLRDVTPGLRDRVLQTFPASDDQDIKQALDAYRSDTPIQSPASHLFTSVASRLLHLQKCALLALRSMVVYKRKQKWMQRAAFRALQRHMKESTSRRERLMRVMERYRQVCVARLRVYLLRNSMSWWRSHVEKKEIKNATLINAMVRKRCFRAFKRFAVLAREKQRLESLVAYNRYCTHYRMKKAVVSVWRIVATVLKKRKRADRLMAQLRAHVQCILVIGYLTRRAKLSQKLREAASQAEYRNTSTVPTHAMVTAVMSPETVKTKDFPPPPLLVRAGITIKKSSMSAPQARRNRKERQRDNAANTSPRTPPTPPPVPAFTPPSPRVLSPPAPPGTPPPLPPVRHPHANPHSYYVPGYYVYFVPY